MEAGCELLEKNIKLAYSSPIALHDADVWTAFELGFSKASIGSRQSNIHFSGLRLLWLKRLVKETVWRKRSSVKLATLRGYLNVFMCFDRYIIETFGSQFKFGNISRKVIEGFINHISGFAPSSQKTYLGQL